MSPQGRGGFELVLEITARATRVVWAQTVSIPYWPCGEGGVMWWKSAGLMAIVVLTAVKAAAQDPRAEISATAGWTFSNGV